MLDELIQVFSPVRMIAWLWVSTKASTSSPGCPLSAVTIRGTSTGIDGYPVLILLKSRHGWRQIMAGEHEGPVRAKRCVDEETVARRPKCDLPALGSLSTSVLRHDPILNPVDGRQLDRRRAGNPVLGWGVAATMALGWVWWISRRTSEPLGQYEGDEEP